MKNMVNLKCFCGELKGELEVISRKQAFHVQCFCKDCQNFAVYLANEEKILDEYGGSELFQTYPANIKITEGVDKISCIQLKEKGLMRWYSSCCHTPIANTMISAKIPFAGLSVKFMSFDANEDKQKILGPVIVKAFGKSARKETPRDVHDTFPRSFMLRILKFMILGFLTSKYRPSPFFVAGKPISEPKVIKV